MPRGRQATQPVVIDSIDAGNQQPATIAETQPEATMSATKVTESVPDSAFALLEKIAKDVASIKETQETQEERISSLEKGGDSSSQVAKEEFDGPKLNHTAPEEYVRIVEEICGKGFEVHTAAIPKREAFKLTIIPPQHLREIADNPVTGESEDRRVKVINFVEGAAGVRAYAERVADFCSRWATKNHVSYDRHK